MKYLLLVFISFFIISCGSSSSDNLDSNNSPVNQNNIIDTNSRLLNQLNNIRINAGMIALTNNKYLNSSAYNHAFYLDTNNKVSHYESSNDKNFTGVKPVDRTNAVGFKSTMVSENLSVGQATEESSLKGLMSAIYHRFGFLDFSINTIGYGKENVSYVYNMGNSDLNHLCEGTSFNSSGSTYVGVCVDSSFKIEASVYENKLNKTINANPSYVIYPYNNEKNVTTSFYEETPDPLPSYDVSGYPISIEFNKNQYDMSKFSVNNFIIKNENDVLLELAVDYKDGNSILSKPNDINNHISYYQFAIFPKNRLNFNTNYTVEFSYTYEGVSKNIIWGFKTEKLDNFIQYNNSTLNLDRNTKYNIYIPPVNKNDIYNRFSLSCSNNLIDIEFFDLNTLKISGYKTSSCTLSLSNTNQTNTKTINININ